MIHEVVFEVTFPLNVFPYLMTKIGVNPNMRSLMHDGVSSSVNFTASVEDIAGIDEHKIGGQLALGGYKSGTS